MEGKLRKVLTSNPDNGSYRCGDLKAMTPEDWLDHPNGTEWTRQLIDPAKQLAYQDDDAELFQWHVGDPTYDLGWYWCVAYDFVALPPNTYIFVHGMRPETDAYMYRGAVRVNRFGHHELKTWWWGQECAPFHYKEHAGWAMNTIVVPADIPIHPPVAMLPYNKVEELVQL